MARRTERPDDDLDPSHGEEETRQTVEQRPYERGGSADLTTVIVEAVAAAEGVDPTAVTSPPLYEVVDVAAIEDGFFGPEIAGDRRDSAGSVNFRYRGFLVTVTSDGWVAVAERTET